MQLLETIDARRKHIFNNYVERMFKPRTHRTIPDASDDQRPGDERFSKEKTIHWLSWLAKRMSEHGQTVFLIEKMQSEWLPTRAQQWSGTWAVVVMIGISSGLLFGRFVGQSPGLLTGRFIGLFFGGLACIQHLVLRIMLWRNGSAPLNYARFLDCAAGRIFLRKVGGGYIFVHRLLLEYFASLEPE